MNAARNPIEDIIRENMTEGMLEIDSRGTIRYANRFALNILGKETKEVIGQKIGPLFLQEAQNDDFIQLIIDAFLQPEAIHEQTVTLNRSGEIIYIKAVAQSEMVLDQEKRHTLLATVCFQDISDYIRREKLEEKITELNRLNRSLKIRNNLIRKIFGCFILRKQGAESLITTDQLQALNNGIQKKVTVIQSDLRGYTAMSYHLSGEDMLAVMNRYISAMSEVILAHHGVIVEVMGDGIISVFGAFGNYDSQCEDAAATAVEMQQKMQEVNAWIREHQYDTYLKMGIGIDCGEAILGFVGNGVLRGFDAMGEVIGRADKIQSNTIEGDILISEEVRRGMKAELDIGKVLEVSIDADKEKVKVYQVKGIGAPYHLQCPVIKTGRIRLHRPADVFFYRINGKARDNTELEGRITEISDQDMCIECRQDLAVLTNVVMEIGDLLYGKITEKENDHYVISFTSSAANFTEWKEALLRDTAVADGCMEKPVKG